MAESITPVEIVPLEQAAPPVSGAEAYFCGEEGWDSTAFPQLEGLVRGGGLGFAGGFAFYELGNTFIGNPENFGNYSGAIKAGIVLAGLTVAATVRGYFQDRRNQPAPETPQTFADQIETHKHYYAMLAGRVALPDVE